MSKTPVLSGSALNGDRHLCAFFRGADEQYRIMLPFIREGLERGEKAVHVVKRSEHARHLERLRAAGIDVGAAMKRRQLDLLDWERTYLGRARFDMTRMPRLIEGLIAESRAQGFPLLRYIGNMEWCLEDRPGVEDVLEYESQLHLILPKYKDPVVCCYDVTKYEADFVVDMLRVHRTALVCGIVNENPYFVPPKAYLAERRTAARRDREEDGRTVSR